MRHLAAMPQTKRPTDRHTSVAFSLELLMLVMLFGVHPAYSSIVAGARLALHPGGGRAPLPLQFALLVSETPAHKRNLDR